MSENVKPVNGEFLLSYWIRVGGKFEAGFLERAINLAARHGFFTESARLYNTLQMEAL